MLFQLKRYNFQGDLQCCHYRCNNNWHKLSDRILNQGTFDISLFNGTNWNATEQIIYEYEFLDISNILNFLVGSFEKVREPHLCYFLFPIATNWVFLLSSLCTPLWPSPPFPPLQGVGLTAPAQLQASCFSIIAPTSSHRTDFCFPLHSPLSPVPTLARGGSSLPLFNCMQTISALIPHSFLGIDVVVYMTPPLPLHFPIVPALQLTPTRGGA